MCIRDSGDRFGNWIKYYNDFEGNLNDFMALDKITFRDKIWVGFRVLNRNQQIEFACQCAELVLPIYEKYNSDSSVLKTAINAARTVVAIYIADNTAINAAAARAARAALAAAIDAADALADAADAAFSADALADAADAAFSAEAADDAARAARAARAAARAAQAAVLADADAARAARAAAALAAVLADPGIETTILNIFRVLMPNS